MKHDDFERHFFAFFESISWHHFLNVDFVHDPQFEPQIQRPPDIVSPNTSGNQCQEWSDNFMCEIKSYGELLQ